MPADPVIRLAGNPAGCAPGVEATVTCSRPGPGGLTWHRHRLLEAVDPPLAGCDRLRTVRAGNRHDHRRLTDLEPARAVRHRDPRLRPPLRDLLADLAHLSGGHLGVRLVVEVRHRAAARDVAHHPGERADRARTFVCDRRLQPPRIERIHGELEQDSAMSPAADGRDERDLVAVGDRRAPIAELLVERGANRSAIRKRRVLQPQGFVDRGER
jgi:hypothetical protein